MLTKKREAFCLAYLNTDSASDAYRQAGFGCGGTMKTVNEAACRLLKNGKIKARIEELREPAVKKAKLTLEHHLNDLKDLRDKAATDEQFSAAITAEIARGKASGLYTDKLEHLGKDGSELNPVIRIQFVDPQSGKPAEKEGK